MLRTVVESAVGAAPCGPPINVICGRPGDRRQGEADVFTTPTGLKLEPAVPLPLNGVSVSWPDTQVASTPGRVEVVVLEEVLDVEVVVAMVVEVEVEVVVEVEDGGGTVVVVGVAALEHPATVTTNPSVMRSRLATT